MNQILQTQLNQTPLVYVTRDIERGLALDPAYVHYHIITNDTPYAREIAQKRSNIHLITPDKILDTYELLDTTEAKKIISSIPNAKIVVFKSSKKIENLCKKNAWELLNPSSAIAQTIEGKISQLEWLEKDADLLPPHTQLLVKELPASNFPYIIQFNTSHTGSGTHKITSAEDLSIFKTKFPERPVRKVAFIDGPILTANIAVTTEVMFVGNFSYQITGIPPFTRNPFATIGNDWALPHTLLTDETKKQCRDIAEKIATRMQKSNWRGLFGIDLVLDEKTQKVYLLEINARQPASTTFESQLQMQQVQNKDDISIFEAHLLGLFSLPTNEFTLSTIKHGAQIVQRIVDETFLEHIRPRIRDIKNSLENLELTQLWYENTEINTELVRMQTNKSFLSAHNTFNNLGAKIAQLFEL